MQFVVNEIVLHQERRIGRAALVCTVMLERFIVEEHRKAPGIMLFVSVQQWGSIVTAPKIKKTAGVMSIELIMVPNI